MSKEIEVIDGHTVNNHAAMSSFLVMEQWGNGETYSEERWIERGRQAVRQTMEGMFELGRALIVLKEHTEHGRFEVITKEQFGIGRMEVSRLIRATQRFATPQMQKAQAKLMDLGKSKLLELLVEDDVTLAELAEGGDINGHTLDDIDRMTRNELRAALRESRETAEAKDKVIADKSKKIDEYAEKLERSKKTVKEPKAEDVGSELALNLSALTVGVRSQISRLKDLFEQMNAHGTAHGLDHRASQVGVLNQIILDCEILRENFNLPQQAPDAAEPEWLPSEHQEAE